MLVHPGASVSVSDVHDGLLAGLQREHQVYQYDLAGRIVQSGAWFHLLEKRRAKENNTPFMRPKPVDVLFQAGMDLTPRALYVGAEWVVVVSSMYLLKQSLLIMKRAGLKVAIYFTESPYDDAQQEKLAGHADICWTNERSSVGRLRVWNPNSYYLPHAYAAHHKPATDDAGNDDVAAHDVVFVGTGFQERVEMLGGVNWEGIDFGLYGVWSNLASRHRLRKYVKGKETDNRITAALYRKAKIGLNLYRTSKGFGRHAARIDYAESMSPRAYELAACGLFHLSEYRKEAAEAFGGRVPAFQTPKELEHRIREWLPKEEERKRIAKELPGAIAGETWDARAREIISALNKHDRQKVAV